jgi:hypothetical protein
VLQTLFEPLPEHVQLLVDPQLALEPVATVLPGTVSVV